MKIICSLKPAQIKGLYGDIYSDMEKALSKKELDVDAYLTSLFNEIQKVADTSTAVKFLQAAPLLMYTASTKIPNFATDVTFDPSKLLALHKRFSNESGGLKNTLDYFTFMESPSIIKESIYETKLNVNVIPETDDKSKIEPFKFRSILNPFSTMPNQFYVGNAPWKAYLTANKLFTTEMEDVKFLFKALKKIEAAQDSTGIQVVYQGKELKVVPTLLSKLPQDSIYQFDQRWFKSGKYAENADKVNKNFIKAEDLVVVVMTDKNGKPVLFDEDGNISPDGKILYQEMRTAVKKDGEFRLINRMGNDLFNENTYKNFAKIQGITEEQVKKQLQSEFETLYKIRQDALKGKSTLLNVIGIHAGQQRQFFQKNLNLANIDSLNFVDESTFKSIDVVKTGDEQFSSGVSVITLLGDRYQLERADLTEEIIDKISDVLLDENLGYELRKQFLQTYLSLKSADTQARHKILYLDNNKKIVFKYFTKTQLEGRGEEKTLTLTEDNRDEAKAIIKDVLMNGRVQGPKGKETMAPVKMHYSSDNLKYNEYLDYVDGKIQTSEQSYIDFLKTLPGTTILATNNYNDKVNQAIWFSPEGSALSNFLDNSNENNVDSLIRQNKDAIAERLKTEGSMKAPVISIDKGIDENGNPYGFYKVFGLGGVQSMMKVMMNKDFLNLDAADIPVKQNDELTFVLRDDVVENGTYFDVVAAFLGDQRVGELNETDFGNEAMREPTPFETKQEKKEKLKKENTKKIEGKDQGNSTEDDGGIAGKYFTRSKKLKKDKGTEAQNKKAEEWFANSELSKYLDLRRAVNIVNSDAYADFLTYSAILGGRYGVITLFGDASSMDIYHEAWHGFTQLFLTKNQKKGLYNEVRKRLKGAENLSYEEIEEILAEDFRTYAKNPKAKKGSPKRNSIFRQILNFIKALLGVKSNSIVTNVFEIQTVKELYENLYYNKNLNNYQPSLNNIKFNYLRRSTGITSKDKFQVLDRQDSKDFSGSLDSFLTKEINAVAKELNYDKSFALKMLLDDRNKKVFYETAFKHFTNVKKDFESKLKTFEESAEQFGFEIENTKNTIRILEEALDNWGNSTYGTIKFHLENSDFTIINNKNLEELKDQIELDEDIAAEEDISELEKFRRDEVGKKSLLEIADKETIFMLKSLFAVDNDGNFVKDIFGEDKLADFNVTWNNTARAIAGLQDPVAMYEALKKASEMYTPFKQLIDFRLPNPEFANISKGNTAYFNQRSITGLWQAFSKTRVPYLQYTIFGDNATVIQASIQSDKILREFRNKYRSSESDYIIRDPETNSPKLNLGRVITDFSDSKGNLSDSKYLEFARAIGISLDESPTIRQELSKDEKAKSEYGLPYIFNFLKIIQAVQLDVNSTEEQINDLNEFLLEPIRSFYRGIPNTLIPGSKPVNQKSQLLNLAQLQGRFGDVSNIFGVVNAEGNVVYEFINNNSTSKQIFALNNAKKLSDMWTSEGYMSYLNPKTNTFTRNSAVLRSLFYGENQNNERRPNVDLLLFINSGTRGFGEGVSTTSLDYYGKLLQEANTMVSYGMQEFMRTSSKKSSFGAKVEGGIRSANRFENLPKPIDPYLYVPMKMIAENEYRMHLYRNFALPYLASELDRIHKFKSNPEVFKTYAGYNRLLSDGKTYAGEMLTGFADIIQGTNQSKLNALIEQSIKDNQYFDALALLTDPTSFVKPEQLQETKDMINDIYNDINSYFDALSEETLAEFSEMPYISQETKDKLIELKVPAENFNQVFTKTYAINAFIHNFEMANLFLGDIVQFNHLKDDLHKRNPGATSTAPSFRTDISFKEFAAGWLKDTSYAQQNGKQYLDYSRGTFDTAVLSDPERRSEYLGFIEEALRDKYNEELKDAERFNTPAKLNAEVKKRVAADLEKFKNIEEADGQGYITFDAYRVLKNAEGQWSVELEDLFQKISRGEEISSRELTKFTPIYKLFHFGFLADTKAPVTAMHKFALVPLLPSVYSENTDLGKLHDQMMAENIQYVTFKTGSKLGSVSSLDEQGNLQKADNPFASDEQKEISDQIKFTRNTIYLEYLKNVTEVANKFKGASIISTQARALILKGLYQDGKVINPKYKKEADAYVNAVKELTDIKIRELLLEINWTKKDGKYIGKTEDFLNLVVRELGRKGLPQHQIDYIQTARDGSVRQDLSFHLEADTIEKMMVSIIEKRLITQKARGESLIQMSSTFSKGLVTGLTEEQQNDVKFVGSNNFPFFTINADGRTNGMKVGIAMQGDYVNLLNMDDPAGLTEGVYNASFAQLESTQGDDKLFILESALTPELLEELEVDDKQGKRVKGEQYEGIDILGDFYSHKTLKSRDGDALDIIVVKDQETARKQVKAYKEGGAKQFTKLFYQREGNIKQPIGIRKRLNELIKDDAWLDANNKANRKKITLVGSRIPGQTHGSLPFMEVYEFLDPTFANTIIVPAEFLTISGSDLDVDSIKTLMKNLNRGGSQAAIGGKVSKAPITRLSKGDQLLMFPETNMEDLDKLLENTSEKYLRSILAYRNKVAENNLMDAIVDILSLPINRGNIVQPLSSEEGKNLAYKLAPFVSDYNANKAKVRRNSQGNLIQGTFFATRTLEPIANHQKHKMFLDGKRVLGIAAIENKLNPIFNMIGAEMPGFYMEQIWSEQEGRYIEGEREFDVELFLPHNKTTDDRISLSKLSNVEGEDIGQLSNLFVDGLVDVENDPWIFYLQANYETIPVTEFLIKAGVPLETIAYFVANPYVVEYSKQQRIMKGAYAKTLDMVPKMKGKPAKQLIPYAAAKKTMEKFAPKYIKGIMKSKALSNAGYYDAIEKYIWDTKVLNKDDYFKFSDLKQNVESRSPMDNYTAMVSFLHFLELEKQIKGVTALKLNSNRDTTRSKSLAELILRDSGFDTLLENSKIDEGLATKMKEESIISSFFIQDLVQDLIKPVLKFRNKDSVNDFILEEIRSYTKGMTRDEVSSFLTRFKNGIQDAVFQNVIDSFSDQDVALPFTDRKLTMSYDNITGVGEDNFSETFMEIVLALPNSVKERFPILGQFEVIPQKRIASEREIRRREAFSGEDLLSAASESRLDVLNMLKGKQDLKIVSLVNIADVKRNPDLADRYNRDLVELANPNVKKLDNAKDNAALSSLFAMFPLVSTLQTGAGSYNPLSLSAILPQEVYYNIMSNVGEQWSDKYLDRTELRKIAFLNEDGRYYIDYTERVERPVMVDPEVTQLELFEKSEPVALVPQQLVSGVEQYGTLQEARPEIKQALNAPNPTSMEMILAGFRTRTTRSKTYLDENPIKVGDIIEHEGIVSNGKLKSVKSVVTAIHPKGTDEYLSTWNLEGWTESGVEKIKRFNDGAAAIVFKVVGIDAVTANQDTVGEKIINDADISSFKKYVKKAKGYPQQFFTSTTTFTEFYNNNTGRREGAPQTSSWVRQSNGRYDLIDVMTGEEYITNVDLETGIQYLSPRQVQVETLDKNDPSDFTGYSGAATGADALFNNGASKYGIAKFVDYTTQSYDELTPEQKLEVEAAYKQAVKDLGRRELSASSKGGKLVRRDYLQAKAGDAVFAISTILNPGQVDKKGYTNRTNKQVVEGGTGYAVQMAINLGKPVFVYDQIKEQWFTWDGSKFSTIETPSLTKKFTGVGSRSINESGKQAIEDVYEKTFAEENVEAENITLQQQIEAINIQLELFKENKPGNKPGTDRTELNGCNV